MCSGIGKNYFIRKNTYCEMNRKKKEGLHGIGLKNVEHVITSYGGNYSIKNTGKIYCDYFILDGRIEIQAAEKRTFTDIM